MASPRPSSTPAASTQPLTPPAERPPSANKPPPTTIPAPAPIPPQVPGTSLQDNGKTRRPRDARLIHMLLASAGVTAYQERVPLQLLDFAYRYTSSVLQDAVYLATEGYAGEMPGSKGDSAKAQSAPQEVASVSLQALRLSIASRLHYQFQPGLPKEFLMDIAAERNRIMLPGVSRGSEGSTTNTSAPGVIMGGMRLPPERFCQTGVGWGLKEEWESEGEEEMEVDAAGQQVAPVSTAAKEEGGAEDDDVDGKMEDIFGEDAMDEDNADGDKIMTGV
ncbi:Transcription initiation factor TFIID subunit 9 [Ophidiomyces ophidiicola]|nr:Transcription initiation factor TFIID subunit 9 [Ophidiomyces ophidiicola]KAI1996691.1 Transcription initiation factor TFIID subunit 9 [Ophidiomyces ophidiicola]KAI1997213.1 Transcription initiation factor TFIID subunit 9 [Ophidiomyces ophidiicola]KAI2003724.1 Transcription initiation factor TFIID subunit 9 [Ophidiomyces ophidiicola]